MLSIFLKKQKADYTEHLIKGPILYPAARMAENPNLSTGKARLWERSIAWENPGKTRQVCAPL